jgi:hypothetical protein
MTYTLLLLLLLLLMMMMIQVLRSATSLTVLYPTHRYCTPVNTTTVQPCCTVSNI